jgi:multidrug transporter EmrE-like cation transporter
MFYLFIALIFYTAALLFSTAASRNLNTNIAAAVTNALSVIVPLAVAIPLLSKKTLASHNFGLLMAVCAGLCIAVFAMALNKSLALNKVAVVVPIIYGGTIVLSSVLSLVLFKEKVSSLEAIGLAVLTGGFGLVIYARILAK